MSPGDVVRLRGCLTPMTVEYADRGPDGRLLSAFTPPPGSEYVQLVWFGPDGRRRRAVVCSLILEHVPC